MDCTVDWWSFTELGVESAGPAACSCEECLAKFRNFRAAGLMPPVGADEGAWWSEREASCAHAEAVPSRRRRRFERESEALARREAYEVRHGYGSSEPSRKEMEDSLASFREWESDAERQGDLLTADYWRGEIVSTSALPSSM